VNGAIEERRGVSLGVIAFELVPAALLVALFAGVGIVHVTSRVLVVKVGLPAVEARRRARGAHPRSRSAPARARHRTRPRPHRGLRQIDGHGRARALHASPRATREMLPSPQPQTFPLPTGEGGRSRERDR